MSRRDPAEVGAALRGRREALGVGVDRMATILGIAEDYVVALEEGAVHRLPPGPYAEAYARSYQRALDRLERAASGAPGEELSTLAEGGRRRTEPPSVPTPEGEDAPPSDPVVRITRPVVEPPPPPRGVPYRVVRTLGLVAVGLLVLLLLGYGASEYWRWRTGGAAFGPAPIEVSVELNTNARLRVTVDGQLVADRVFAGGERERWRARERIELGLPDVNVARVWFGEQRIHPQGRRNKPRTLVFVNDARGG